MNALVALARCIFWFNPLIHAGAKAMRIDQELSCDAEVIDRRPRGVRRAYAETLLKTQLASGPLPVGCYWPAEAQHPLAERIDMLARKPVSSRRRIAATAIVLVLSASAGVAAWAAQPERTVFREAPDVLVPFQPMQQDEQSKAEPASKPRRRARRHAARRRRPPWLPTPLFADHFIELIKTVVIHTRPTEKRRKNIERERRRYFHATFF